jgi:hypothetical protein
MWDRPEHEPERDESDLESVIDELRADVPMRPEWHARLRRELLAAASGAPATGASAPGAPASAVVTVAGSRTDAMPVRWQLRPITAIAAAVAFTVLGASGALLAGRSAAFDSPAETGPGRVATSPVASNVTTHDVGVRFAVMAPGVRRVSIVGDFNGWNPRSTPLTLSRDGRTWSILLPLASGRHTYAFVIDDEIVADPAAPTAIDDDFGTPSSIVLVGNSLP